MTSKQSGEAGDLASEMADELETMAGLPAYAPRADDLRRLSDGLRDPESDTWVGLDLLTAFPVDSSVAVRHAAGRLEHVLGILAGAAVFAPVAWTWWGLHSAAKAYKSYMAEEPEGGRTFLGLWTDGFGGRLTGLHQFVPLTLISVLIVVVAVGLIIAHRVVAHSTFQHQESEADKAKSRLVSTLVRAQHVLNLRRADNPQLIEHLIKRSIRQLSEAHKQSLEGVQIIRQATEDAMSQLTPMLKRSRATAKDLRDAAEASRQTSDQLLESVATAEDRLEELRTRSTEAMETTLRRVEAVAQQAGNGISSEIGKTQTSTQQLGAQVGMLVAANRTLNDDAASNMARLVDAIARTNEALAAQQSATQAQMSEFTAARDALERLARQLERAAQERRI